MGRYLTRSLAAESERHERSAPLKPQRSSSHRSDAPPQIRYSRAGEIDRESVIEKINNTEMGNEDY
jgi:hypothetical protein